MYELTIQVELLHQFLQITTQMVPMETVTDWLIRQLGDVKAVIITGIGVVALGGAAAKMVKAQFSLGSVIVVALMLALVLWLTAGSGSATLSELIGQQAATKD